MGVSLSEAIGNKEGTKCVGCSLPSHTLNMFTLLFAKGQIKSYSSRNAVMASTFSFTFEMMFSRSDFVNSPFSFKRSQSHLKPLSWLNSGGGVSSWIMISTNISGLRSIQLHGQIKILISLKVNYQPCFMKILENFFRQVSGAEVIKVVNYIRKLFKA